MKKLLIVILTVLLLSGCETALPNEDKELVCTDTQTLIDDICIDNITVPTCTVDEELVNNVCEEIVVVNCVPGFSEVDGKCIKDTVDLTCEYDQIIENGICVDLAPDCIEGQVLENGLCIPKEDASTGPDYEYPDVEAFSGRNLVADECNHLENIGEWQPVWCDEFEYEGLPDTSLWNYDVGGHGWGNGESQYYTNADSDNVNVTDGLLTITAIKESYSSNQYTSARLVTKDKGDWLYGKIQVRAKLPSGVGTWPAIWMLPTDWKYGGWPKSGEIDIMEYVGYDKNRVHTTIHTGAYNHSIGTQVGVSKLIEDPENQFHVYEIEWEPGIIRTMINGTLWKTFEYDPEESFRVDNFMAWPFDEQFHLILNIAVGGAWGGAQGIDNDIFPQELIIDYVRVFQKDYAGMDESAPNDVTGYEMLQSGTSDAYIMWEKALDDVMVKEYKIFVDGNLFTTSSLNGYRIDSLDPNTTYNLEVVAVDFAGNESTATSYSFMTAEPSNHNDRIEAEDYSLMTGIETETTTDAGGGENIGWVDTGDTLSFNVDFTASGVFTTDLRISSPNGGTIDIFIDGVKVTTVTVQATGGWQNWQTATSTNFNVDAGSHILKLVFTSSGINLNYIEFN